MALNRPEKDFSFILFQKDLLNLTLIL